MIFSFESFCNKVKNCTNNILSSIVFGNWYGNTLILIVVFFILNYFMSIMIPNFIVYIICYCLLLILFLFLVINRKIGFGMGKNGFVYVIFSCFYKPKKVYEIPFDNIKYLVVRKNFSVTLVNMSFIDKDGRLKKIKFRFNTMVFGLSTHEHKKNSLNIYNKLIELQKQIDRGDF